MLPISPERAAEDQGEGKARADPALQAEGLQRGARRRTRRLVVEDRLDRVHGVPQPVLNESGNPLVGKFEEANGRSPADGEARARGVLRIVLFVKWGHSICTRTSLD